MTTQDTGNARSQAKAQLDTIIEMLARLDHAEKCDGLLSDCPLTDEELCAGVGYWLPENGLDETERNAYREDYHDIDAARAAIQEDALSVETRSGWHSPGEQGEDEEYCILLCTGGPAVRIIGELDQYNEPSSARLQYQDWFTPWEEYVTTGDDDDALIRFASFYLGF